MDKNDILQATINNFDAITIQRGIHMGIARAAAGVAVVKHHHEKKEDKKEAKEQEKEQKKT